jgi:hypothetical protein
LIEEIAFFKIFNLGSLKSSTDLFIAFINSRVTYELTPLVLDLTIAAFLVKSV